MKYPCLLTKSIKELSPAKYNPRKISDEAMGRLTKSLAEFGNIQPITWNARTGNVVGGHQRLKVYQAMGKTEVEVWAVDLDEQKEKAANIALNKLSGEFDLPMLKDILEEIDTGELDLEITGFGMDEIALMMEDAHPEVTEDEVPEVPVDAITKPGDLWLLGEHRLLCGDSTKADDVSKLNDGQTPSIMITDPPYGVQYDANWRNKAKRADGTPIGASAIGKVENDQRADWTDSWKLFLGDVAYIWHAGLFAPIVARGLNDSGFELRAQIIWAKNNFAIGRGDYHWKHEPCWYGVRKGKTANTVGDRTQTTLWEINKPQKSETGHSTQKPIECMARPIKNHNFDLVYDPFLGSGTTLIAAEQLGRKCYGMEISPNYCDVIVKRWENLTGKKAVLEKSE
jgi:DNA modification methylase